MSLKLKPIEVHSAIVNLMEEHASSEGMKVVRIAHVLKDCALLLQKIAKENGVKSTAKQQEVDQILGLISRLPSTKGSVYEECFIIHHLVLALQVLLDLGARACMLTPEELNELEDDIDAEWEAANDAWETWSKKNPEKSYQEFLENYKPSTH
jgi:hypothetical protein